MVWSPVMWRLTWSVSGFPILWVALEMTLIDPGAAMCSRFVLSQSVLSFDHAARRFTASLGFLPLIWRCCRVARSVGRGGGAAAAGAAAPFAGFPFGGVPLVPLTANAGVPVAPAATPVGPATAAIQAAVPTAAGGVPAPPPAMLQQAVSQVALPQPAVSTTQPAPAQAPQPGGTPVGGFDPTPIQDM